ncbi:MAG TPA: ArsA-related P-loop ATPase [Solirubrobacteraceae bacterium]|jgi:anion-transporting  ArsA/GET3 family ATPase|nr:ArsA-related P-loop ATPase [Solirubrobacteraceae bacterium]
MTPLLQRRLIVLTGKGGAGKTTIAGALGLLAAREGLRTLVVEVGERQHIPTLLARPEPAEPGVVVELMAGLSSLSIDPDRVLADWLRTLGGRVTARVLLSSTTFQYFVAAAPGAREILSLVKVLELTEGVYDLVILDAPATGHAIALLSSPRTFAGLARVGPIAAQARLVSELLEDPERSGYVAVARGTEMAVTETLELRESLREELGRELDVVIANAALPRRFDERELSRIAMLDGGHEPLLAGGGQAPMLDGQRALIRSASRAAHAVHARAQAQNNQIARLRRQRLQVLRVPFVFTPGIDEAALLQIAERLGRGL